jgi:transcription elongation factor Elf1
MSMTQETRPRKRTYQRAMVACRKCGTPIYVYKVKALADEFSVHCSRCGDRGIYFKRAITIEELPERRKKPRK